MRQNGFAVEVSGGHEKVDGLIATSNVTSTMFAERHTKSILSDDTIQENNQNLISREQSEVQHHHPVITEEITSTDREDTHPESTALGQQEFEVGTRETIQIEHRDDGDMRIEKESEGVRESVSSEVWQNQYIQSEEAY